MWTTFSINIELYASSTFWWTCSLCNPSQCWRLCVLRNKIHESGTADPESFDPCFLYPFNIHTRITKLNDGDYRVSFERKITRRVWQNTWRRRFFCYSNNPNKVRCWLLNSLLSMINFWWTFSRIKKRWKLYKENFIKTNQNVWIRLWFLMAQSDYLRRNLRDFLSRTNKKLFFLKYSFSFYA